MRVPDVVEPVVGWRVWNVVEADGALLLASLVYHELWLPGRELEARCRRPLAALPWSRLPLHEPPARDCCCGVHALESPAVAAAYLASPVEHGPRAFGRVLGAVSLWGRVVEAERGWRAGVGYPARLLVPDSRRRRFVATTLWPYRPAVRTIATELEAYGVPVEVVDEPALAAPPRASARRAG
jgi:hypothetical protein